jgi:hypothetical protein
MDHKNTVKYRETLLVIVLGFSVLYLILDRDWLFYTALATGIAGMLSLDLNRWIHMAWHFLGEKLGFVVGKVILGIIFLLILLPMGMLSRVFRKDPLKLRVTGKSNYHQRDHRYEAGDLENMW